MSFLSLSIIEVTFAQGYFSINPLSHIENLITFKHLNLDFNCNTIYPSNGMEDKRNPLGNSIIFLFLKVGKSGAWYLCMSTSFRNFFGAWTQSNLFLNDFIKHPCLNLLPKERKQSRSFSFVNLKGMKKAFGNGEKVVVQMPRFRNQQSCKPLLVQ